VDEVEAAVLKQLEMPAPVMVQIAT